MSGVTRRRFLSGLTVAAVGAAAAGCASGRAPARRQAANAYRLPQTATPHRYDIRLEPDLEAGRFSGEETVDISLREPSTVIVLNALDLELREASIRDATGRTVRAAGITLDPKTERLHLSFPEPIAAGRYQLAL